jgi:hypothetical protein
MSNQEAWSYYHSENAKNMSKNTPSGSTEQPHNENELILCDSCFWCASSVPGFSSINICPVCRTKNVHAMPISNNDNKYNAITSQPSGLFVESL